MDILPIENNSYLSQIILIIIAINDFYMNPVLSLNSRTYQDTIALHT
jgi:hypothetical protein